MIHIQMHHHGTGTGCVSMRGRISLKTHNPWQPSNASRQSPPAWLRLLLCLPTVTKAPLNADPAIARQPTYHAHSLPPELCLSPQQPRLVAKASCVFRQDILLE